MIRNGPKLEINADIPGGTMFLDFKQGIEWPFDFSWQIFVEHSTNDVVQTFLNEATQRHVLQPSSCLFHLNFILIYVDFYPGGFFLYQWPPHFPHPIFDSLSAVGLIQTHSDRWSWLKYMIKDRKLFGRLASWRGQQQRLTMQIMALSTSRFAINQSTMILMIVFVFVYHVAHDTV